MESPCFGCERRRVGCHGECEQYQAFARERAALREARRLQKEIDGAWRRGRNRFRASHHPHKKE